MPRQITTFEFKLIGFLTLKQFIYLALFIPAGYIVYKVFPIPILNIFFGAIVACVGLAFAFLPVNDRPLDVWVKNLFKRLTSPTQYIYQKQDQPIYFLKNLFFSSDPHHVTAHVESEEMLAAYMAKTKQLSDDRGKENITQILNTKNISVVQKPSVAVNTIPQPTVQGSPFASEEKKPFFAGEVKNHKLMPIPGILIYVKDEKGKMVRLLKTNPHGIFATFSPLSTGVYSFEAKDPKQSYFFDTMKLKVEGGNANPIEIFSRELI